MEYQHKKGAIGMEILRVEHVGLTYQAKNGEVSAFEDISFAVEEGEFLSIVGPSGCGKSTLLSVIAGLLPATRGEVYVKGERVHGTSPHIGYMLQRDNLLEWRTILSNVLFGLEIRGTKTPQTVARAKRLLETYGLSAFADKYPRQLSGGMRQRAMIAIALGARPKLLLADEPTTALDVTIQDQIMKLLNQLKQELGMSIILVTHDLGVIAQMCDRVAVMYAGQIVEMTDTVTLFSRPRHPYTYGLMGSLPNEETAGTTLEAIKGSPPNLAHLPEGCPFSPRCKYACDLCRRERPALTEVEPGHLARCHRLDVTASFQGLIEVPDGAGRKEDTPHG